MVRVFEEAEEVVLAYVFGSVPRGEAGPLSDLDFAVYLDESVPAEDYLDIELELRSELARSVGENLDLVVMNSASPLMNYNVVSSGELLYAESNSTKVAVESRIVNRFLDRKYYEERHADRRLEKFAEEGLS